MKVGFNRMACCLLQDKLRRDDINIGETFFFVKYVKKKPDPKTEKNPQKVL